MLTVDQLTELLKPIVESMGYEWWGMEYRQHRVNSILRVYVDKKEGGITIDDIVSVTEMLSPALDVEEVMSSAYTFEVSSPGMDRPLYTPEQYQRYVGQEIKCQMRFPVQGRRRFQGTLIATDEEKIQLQLSDGSLPEPVELLFAQIDRARVVPQF